MNEWLGLIGLTVDHQPLTLVMTRSLGEVGGSAGFGEMNR